VAKGKCRHPVAGLDIPEFVHRRDSTPRLRRCPRRG
jgi:hypothetical protein